VDKVIVVIKDKDETALERFIFSVQQMIEIEPYNRDTTVDDAMTPATLGSYFRAFLVKLNMIESQLGLLELGGYLICYLGRAQRRSSTVSNPGRGPSSMDSIRPPT
jgi:hypothetical protein